MPSPGTPSPTPRITCLQWREQGTQDWIEVVASTGGATSHTIIPTVDQQGKTYDLRVRALSDDTVHYFRSSFSPEAR